MNGIIKFLFYYFGFLFVIKAVSGDRDDEDGDRE